MKKKISKSKFQLVSANLRFRAEWKKVMSLGIYFLTFSKIAIENKIWNVFCPVHIFGFVKSVAYIYPNSVSKSGVEVFLHECEIYLLCDMTYFCDIERAYYF